ncbi:MAG TPA: glycoside hydrolase family 27 protein [Puia sp.]|nr:glycoside hydrolase family 27 protein [Puia sp.]
MRKLPIVLILFSLCITGRAQPAATPPMGWNSYNCFGSAVHEDEVKANADYMASRLKRFGWQYVVVDFLWAYDNPPGSRIGNPFQSRLYDGSYVPWLEMDRWGRLTPELHKFPSAFGGKGFGPLAAYVHSLGLKFGIHVMRGIPRQAVWAHSPVLGAAGITADQIADTNSTCPWMNHMYGLDMDKPGAQEYLNSLLQLYAQWGVDLIKVDDIARPYRAREIEGYRKAIEACGRPIVLSISPGETPLRDSAHVRRYADMWRMADDFWDSWKEMLKMFDYAGRWQSVGGAGHWPDCDMMQIGKVSLRGPVGPERYSRFTDDELRTHMTFWCIYRSPLMIGGDLPENRPFDEALETNPEVLAVNRRGRHPRQLYKKDGRMVWVSDAPGGKAPAGDAAGKDNTDGAISNVPAGPRAYFVALFNIGDSAQDVAVDLPALGLKGRVMVRDLWKRSDAGTFRKTYTQHLPAHAAALVRLVATGRRANS